MDVYWQKSVFISYIQRCKGKSTNKLEYEFEYATQTQKNEPSFVPYTTKITRLDISTET
jgi:hypothetical protein